MYCLLLPYHCVLNKTDWCLTNGILVICTRSQDAMPFYKNKSSGGMYRGVNTQIIVWICFPCFLQVGTHFEGGIWVNSPAPLPIVCGLTYSLMPNNLKILSRMLSSSYSTFESNMCPQKIILNLWVRTANKIKLDFEARSQNTRLIKFIRQILIHGDVLCYTKSPGYFGVNEKSKNETKIHPGQRISGLISSLEWKKSILYSLEIFLTA